MLTIQAPGHPARHSLFARSPSSAPALLGTSALPYSLSKITTHAHQRHAILPQRASLHHLLHPQARSSSSHSSHPSTPPTLLSSISTSRSPLSIICPSNFSSSRTPCMSGLDLARACHCDPRHIPTLPSSHFKAFLEAVSPTQLVLAYVPGAPRTPLEVSLTQLYEHTHRGRAHPCAHASVDPFRIVLLGAGCNPPLGNCGNTLLIYMNARLVFAGKELDGKGCSLGDLMRQLQRTRRDALRGFCLPQDYHLPS